MTEVKKRLETVSSETGRRAKISSEREATYEAQLAKLAGENDMLRNQLDAAQLKISFLEARLVEAREQAVLADELQQKNDDLRRERVAVSEAAEARIFDISEQLKDARSGRRDAERQLTRTQEVLSEQQ